MTIDEILDDMGVRYLRAGENHHCRPGWIQLDCPFCGRDTERFHLGWNLSLNYSNCWKCGGHFPDAVLMELGLGRSKAQELAKGLVSEHTYEVERTRVSTLLPKGIGPMEQKHRRYLRGRDFNSKTIERIWKVQGIGIAARLKWRLFIPIIYKEKTVSWTTRTVSRLVAQRYVSASAEEETINHKSLVYGQDYCNHSVVICEGPTDAWRIGPGAGALFGTSFTAAQVRKLVEHPYRYVVFDEGAQDQAEELCSQLAVFPGVTENIILDADDPGSASPKEIALLRKVTKL